jgi:hypothetical protein
MVRGSMKASLAERSYATGSSHGEVGSGVDEPSYLDQVEEDSGVDGPRPWGVVVGIRNGLEDLRGQLKPWSVERRYVSPMPVAGWCWLVVAGRAGSKQRGRKGVWLGQE